MDQLIQLGNNTTTNVYPANYIQNITDQDNKQTLEQIIKRIGILLVEYKGSLDATRLQVPEKYRAKGLIVTWTNNNTDYTYKYTGTLTSDAEWVKQENWTNYLFQNSDVGVKGASVLSTNTLDPGTKAAASVSLSDNNLNFTFGIPKGADGAKGEKGDKGDKGDTPIGSRGITVFKISNTKPDKPAGGSVDFVTGAVTYPAGWNKDDSGDGIKWSSYNDFLSDGTNTGWTDPVRITGEDGKPGTDGTGMEFIYKVTLNEMAKPSTPVGENTNDFVPDGWTDSPSGVDSTNTVEWVCTRKKNGDTWSEYTEPKVWSHYGVNGQDGDGVEYIYKLTNTAEQPARPTTSNNTDDYVPDGWTDNPTGVSETNQWEWVCTRKSNGGTWGAFSNPALWAKFGEDGYNGLSTRVMYAKTANSSEKPEFVEDNINPGSIWSLGYPDYDGDEAVWSISAVVTYDNKLNTNWTGPLLCTGVNGKSATPVNYKTYVYYKSDTKPEKPANNDPANPGEGWVDYPNDTGNWWQCIGDVNGTTQLVTSWGEVLPLNGKDGVAQDGARTEFRFAVNDSDTDAPAIDKTKRTPDGWAVNPPTKTVDQFMWMTLAVINANDSLRGNWTDPVLISGERGPQGNTGPAGPAGPTGATGASGTPGIAIELRYCLGTDTTPDTTINDTSKNIREPEGFSKTIPTVTTDKPYIWFIQCRYNPDTNELEDPWSTPARLSGLNGLNGTPGKGGQMIYPAGVYDVNKAYTTTDKVAPYVLDTADGNFYVLNAVMTWKGTEQDNRSPKQDFDTNNGKYWLKFDAFEAVYAKIGIIANGLIGSAVFNGDYMFSQTGIQGYNTTVRYGNNLVALLFKRSSTVIVKSPDVSSIQQENDYSTAPEGWTNGTIPDGTDTLYIQIVIISQSTKKWLAYGYPITQDKAQGAIDSLKQENKVPVMGTHYELFDSSHIYDGNFCPMYLVNLKTGEGHYSGGQIKFGSDGSGAIGNGITWNNQGDLIGELWDNPHTGNAITLPKLPADCSKLVRIPFINLDTDNPASYTLKAENTSAKIVTFKSKASPAPLEATGSLRLTCPSKGVGMIMCNGYLDTTTSTPVETWQVGFLYYTPVEVKAETVTATVDYDVNGTNGSRGKITLSSPTDLNVIFNVYSQYATGKHQISGSLESQPTTITIPANSTSATFDLGNNVTKLRVTTDSSSSSYSINVVDGTQSLKPYATLSTKIQFETIDGKRDTSITYTLHNTTQTVVNSTVSGEVEYTYMSSSGIGGGGLYPGSYALGTPQTARASFQINAGKNTGGVIGNFSNMIISSVTIVDMTVIPDTPSIFWAY